MINPQTVYTAPPAFKPDVDWRPAEVGFLDRGDAIHLCVREGERITLYALGPAHG